MNNELRVMTDSEINDVSGGAISCALIGGLALAGVFLAGGVVGGLTGGFVGKYLGRRYG